jgi:TP901 family phage tail tape measure protein
MPTVRDLLISIRVKDQTKAIDDTDKKLNKAKGSAAGLGKEIKQLAGAFVGMAAAQKALQQVEKSVDTAAKFGAGMAQIATLIPGQTKRVDELKQGILKLASETGKPLDDLTAGAYQVISAFGDSEDTLKHLEVAAKLAVAGNATTAESLGLLSAVTNSYGEVSAKASEHTADLAQNTVALGKTTLPELSHAMGIVAGGAAGLKVTQEELYAIFAANSVVMNGADHVATGLVATFMELTRAGSPANKEIHKMGFATADVAVEVLGVTGLLQKLIATTDGSSDAIAKMIPGSEAQKLVLHAVKDRVKAADDAIVSNAKATGTMTTAFGEATTGAGALAFQLERDKAKLEAMEVALGERMAPSMLKFNEMTLDSKKALFEAFEAQMPGLEHFGAILSGDDGSVQGRMEGIKTTAESVAEVVKLTVGTMTLAFLGMKGVTQTVLGDMMAIGYAASGDFAGAKNVWNAVNADNDQLVGQVSETISEMARSPEESRRFNEQKRRDRRRNELGFEPRFTRTDAGDGVSALHWRNPVDGKFGGISYSLGSGPYRANLPGAEGEAARAEIKSLVINITPDKTVDQAKSIVKDGVSRGVAEGVRDAQRLLPSAPSGVRRGSI